MDITCPWCYIGQRELEKAIKDAADCELTIKVEHRPFLLHPCMDEGKVIDKKTFYLEKFGEEKLKQVKETVNARAETVGVKIAWEGWVCQTIRAHRLLRKAFTQGGQELQEKLLDALFFAYFTEGKNIADIHFLAELADDVGLLTKDQAIEFLKSDEYRAEVEQMANEARKKGVTGVPFTIINGRWAVSGGQTADVYTQIFRKLAGKGPLHPIPAAPSCSDTGCPAAAAAAAAAVKS
ncbi:thioredoxin-like protein [Trametes coccinea BRFM310]|uniref:Thioredoxin-like protein n=2 Tax=Trametes TaxID=5324 RepID=A0A1Y2IZC1_TRAC3|nr:thioredoxin-like protein [Trametes coccinea BRFM310]